MVSETYLMLTYYDLLLILYMFCFSSEQVADEFHRKQNQDDRPDRSISAEQWNEAYVPRQLPEFDLNDIINDLQRDENRPTTDAGYLDNLIKGVAK